MYDIEMNEVSEKFARCLQAAAKHLKAQTHDGRINWLKASLNPPFLEHLSFRLGNQLFFIRLDDVDGVVAGPGNSDGFRTIAKGCNGHACLMPMQFKGGKWQAALTEWGLIADTTRQLINPIDLISEEKIVMTDWELHDFAVQVVRDHIEKGLEYDLMSYQGNPAVNPSIWFVGESGPEWVVVRAAKFPKRDAAPPSNFSGIAAHCGQLSCVGHFASVAFASADDAFDRTDEVPEIPLWRGYGMKVRFEGLISARNV